jgi:TolA-binding protein
MAWHPRWKAEGALGPYLAAPALMLIVPQQETVRLSYARTASDLLGWIASASALVVAALVALRRRRRPAPVTASVPAPVACADDLPAAPRRWGGLIPAALVLLLFGARLLHTPRDRTTEARALYELASKAYADERYPEAAEYARHSAARGQGTPLRDEMLCLRGESLLRAGQPQLAVEAFQTLLQDAPGSPYAAQALFSGAMAREAAGDEPGARADRARLRSEHADTPWARRLEPSRN